MTKKKKIPILLLPLHFVVQLSKKWHPKGLQGLSLFKVAQKFFKEFNLPYFTERASAIAFNFMLSVPPTCLFLFTLIPHLPFLSKRGLKFQLHSLIHDIIPSPTYNRGIIEFIDSFMDGSKIGLISFTFVISLFFASSAVIGLMRSFNKDYIGFEKIKGLKKRWAAIKLTLMLFGLLMICLMLLLLQSNLMKWIGIENIQLRNLILYGKWIFITGLIFYSFAFIYKYAPSTTIRWKLVSPGAIVATFLSILVTLGFMAFVNNFAQYNFLYGSIGTLMVIMIMVFLNSLVVLIGFEFNLSIHTLKSIEEEKQNKSSN